MALPSPFMVAPCRYTDRVLPPSPCIADGPRRLRLKCILDLLVIAWGQLKSVHVQTCHQNKDSSRWTALPVEGERLPL